MSKLFQIEGVLMTRKAIYLSHWRPTAYREGQKSEGARRHARGRKGLGSATWL